MLNLIDLSSIFFPKQKSALPWSSLQLARHFDFACRLKHAQVMAYQVIQEIYRVLHSDSCEKLFLLMLA